MKQNTPEAKFIHLCVLDAAQCEALDPVAATTAVTDWGGLLDLAAQHRVAAYIQDTTAHYGLTLPESARLRLRSLTLVARARAMLIDRLLTQVAGAFAGRAIPVIVLKGPALAHSIYRPAALRTYDDLDLLVRAQDEARAIEALTARGFEELPDEAEDAWRERAGAVEGGAPFHRRFVAPGMPVVVELHVDPLQLGLAPACETERWQRSLPIPGVSSARMLGPEDQVVQLGLHAHKHGYSRLIWLKDIDLLLRSEQERLDWSLVASVAQKEGVAAAVWYTLQLVAALFDTALPEAAYRRLRPSPLMRVLYRHIWPAGDVIELRGQMHRRAVQFRPADALRGSIPSLVLMGRRGARARAGLSATARRLTLRPAHSH